MSSSGSGSSSSSGSDDSAEKKEEEKKVEKVEKVAVVESGSDDSSDSESSEEEKKKPKKKEKKEKKDKKDKKKKKKGKDKKEKKKKGKDGKKKKDKKKGKKGKKDKGKKKKKATNRDAVSNQFGKFGIIKQEDFFNKKPEFLMWAMEVKKTDTDSLGQMQMKDLFKEYVEDFNTATMPSKKYYNLASWDSEQAVKRAKKNREGGMEEAKHASFASFDDEKARKDELRLNAAKKQEELITQEVRMMRFNKAKVEEMRSQKQTEIHISMMQKTGHHEKAEKLKEAQNWEYKVPDRQIGGFNMAG